MSKIVKMKLCEICNEVEIVDSHNRKYCRDCVKERDRRYGRKQAHKKSMSIRKRLDNNFKKNDYRGRYLTPLGFNEISPIKYQNYHNHFRLTWREILKRYGKEQEFTEYLFKKYKEFYKETGNFGMQQFGYYVKVSQLILDTYNHDKFRQSIDMEYNRHTESDLRENFLLTVESLGRLPLINEEFAKHSKIHIQTYVRQHNIKSNHLERIVEKYVSEEEFLKYLTDKRQAMVESEKNRIVKLNGIYKHSDEEVERKVREMIDKHIKKYQQLPSQAEFDECSGMRFQTLRNRYKITYRGMFERLGYDMNLLKINKYSKEHLTVDTYEKILGYRAIPQATFDWLKGDKGWALRCDAYFPNYNLIIEYDGEGHSLPIDFAGRGEEWAMKNLEETQRNDAIKNALIPQHGIKLIRINYDEPYWDEDFLRIRLLENGIVPPNHTIVLDNIEKKDM